MINFKGIVLILFGSYICLVVFLALLAGNKKIEEKKSDDFATFQVSETHLHKKKHKKSHHRDFLTKNSEIISEFRGTYTFTHPKIALSILNLLDTHEHIPEKYYDGVMQGSKHNQTILGLTYNKDYCNQHRRYFVSNSSEFFEKSNFMVDMVKPSLNYKHVLLKMANDTLPDSFFTMRRDIFITPKYNIPINTHHFMIYEHLHYYQEVGESFACSTQEYSRIPGHSSFARKDYLVRSFDDYALRYKDKKHCFNLDYLIPKTFLMYNESYCRDFFDNYLNTEYYQALKAKNNIVFLTKLVLGPHQGEGVFPLDEKREADLRAKYLNGAACGKIKDVLLVQKYIEDPLLINKKKFDFRVYLLIASVNPVIAYYHDGHIKISFHEHNTSSTDITTFVTNPHLTEKKSSQLGQSALDLHRQLVWKLENLQDYLFQIGKIQDKNWLDNHLRKSFKKAFLHMIRASSSSFLKKSQLYELLGCDLMLDENLNVWLIEANTRPLLEPMSLEFSEPFFSVIEGIIEITNRLLRSRLKRIIILINDMSRYHRNRHLKGKGFEKLSQKRERFNEAMKNKFDPEFYPSKEDLHGWEPIIDENLQGKEAYFDLLDEECVL